MPIGSARDVRPRPSIVSYARPTDRPPPPQPPPLPAALSYYRSILNLKTFAGVGAQNMLAVEAALEHLTSQTVISIFYRGKPDPNIHLPLVFHLFTDQSTPTTLNGRRTTNLTRFTSSLIEYLSLISTHVN